MLYAEKPNTKIINAKNSKFMQFQKNSELCTNAYKSRQLEPNDFTGLTLDVNTSENYAEMELWEGERVMITIIHIFHNAIGIFLTENIYFIWDRHVFFICKNKIHNLMGRYFSSAKTTAWEWRKVPLPG